MTASRPRDRSADIPIPNAPTPGSTRRAASRTISGSALTMGVTPRRRNAPAIDARFATPESTVTTSLTAGGSECAFRGRDIVEAGQRDRLPQRERGRLERRFGPMMIVFALQDVDVQRQSRRGRERSQEVADILAREAADRLAFEVERDIGKRAAGEIDNRPCQRLVEGCEGPAEAAEPAPLSQRAVECLSERERTILRAVVVVHLQVAFAGELQIEPRMAA